MPLPLTVFCFSKIQTGFTFLVPAHPGSPGKRAVKRVCVCSIIGIRHKHDEARARRCWMQKFILRWSTVARCLHSTTGCTTGWVNYANERSQAALERLAMTFKMSLGWRAQQGGCVNSRPVVKVDRRISWHYTTTILRLRIGARLTRYRNCKVHNFARTISRHADGISRYSVPPSAGPLLPMQ